MSLDRTIGERINTWVQTIGIVAAGAWAAWTFVVEKYWLPSTAPVNITVDMALERLTASPRAPGMTSIALRISAVNPSTRSITLLPSAWVVYAHERGESPKETPAEFSRRAERAINERRGQYAERFAVHKSSVILASGSLFGDDLLNPSERVARTVMLSVPAGMFDGLEAMAIVPSAEDGSGISIAWSLADNGITLKPTLLARKPDGSWAAATDEEAERLSEESGYWRSFQSTEMPL